MLQLETHARIVSANNNKTKNEASIAPHLIHTWISLPEIESLMRHLFVKQTRRLWPPTQTTNMQSENMPEAVLQPNPHYHGRRCRMRAGQLERQLDW